MCRRNRITNFEAVEGADHRLNNYLLGRTKKGGRRKGSGELEGLVRRALGLGDG